MHPTGNAIEDGVCAAAPGREGRPIRKIITSGFSFSGSSAIHDLLIAHGATPFPGGEMRIFSSGKSFASLPREIKAHGKASNATIDTVVALLRGEARGATEHFSRAVRLSVKKIRSALDGYYDPRVDHLDAELRSVGSRATEACRDFIDDLCNHYGRLTGASTLVFDQGVRPWALNRMSFFRDATVFVCRRDLRDQMIERHRHSLDNSGFEEKIREQTRRFEEFMKRRPQSSRAIFSVWFEDLILDSAERRRVLAAAGLNASIRGNGTFNPIASRRNIGLYRLRPDLAPPALEPNDPLRYKYPGWMRRTATFASDYLRFSRTARDNPAGAYSKTMSLDEVPSKHDEAARR